MLVGQGEAEKEQALQKPARLGRKANSEPSTWNGYGLLALGEGIAAQCRLVTEESPLSILWTLDADGQNQARRFFVVC